MKIILQTLFFFLLVKQICFGQWVQIGLNGQSINDITVQNSNMFAVTADSGKLYRSIDNGASWTIIVDSCAREVAISPTGKVFMIKDSLFNSSWSERSLHSSVDNGNTWTRVNTDWGAPENISASPEGILFCGWKYITILGFQTALAVSSDDGVSWQTPGVLGGTLIDFKSNLAITLGAQSDGGGTTTHICLSADYGSTWTYRGFLAGIFCAVGVLSNGNIIVGEGIYDPLNSTRRILISTDMCSTWTQISLLNTPQVGLSWSSGSLEGIIIGTDSLGVFLFSDEGDSLGSRNEGLTNLNIQALTLDNNGYIYAGTGNGVWRRPLSEVTSVDNELTQPTEFILSQSYPNPFNSSCAIRYSIPQLSQVSLKVFNTLGEEIQTLVNEEKPVGTYELNWYASNLPSGVYFYKLQSGQYTTVKKMILMK